MPSRADTCTTPSLPSLLSFADASAYRVTDSQCPRVQAQGPQPRMAGKHSEVIRYNVDPMQTWEPSVSTDAQAASTTSLACMVPIGFGPLYDWFPRICCSARSSRKPFWLVGSMQGGLIPTFSRVRVYRQWCASDAPTVCTSSRSAICFQAVFDIIGIRMPASCDCQSVKTADRLGTTQAAPIPSPSRPVPPGPAPPRSARRRTGRNPLLPLCSPECFMFQVPPAKSPAPGLDATKEYRTPAPNSQPQANVPVSGEQRLG